MNSKEYTGYKGTLLSIIRVSVRLALQSVDTSISTGRKTVTFSQKHLQLVSGNQSPPPSSINFVSGTLKSKATWSGDWEEEKATWDRVKAQATETKVSFLKPACGTSGHRANSF